MKSRLLKKILNNTNYTISNEPEYIAIGGPLCHDLISVTKKSLKIKYALDTWNEGRACLVKKSITEDPCELLFIYDKLQELIDTGEIQAIIEGQDEIENPLPVFTIDNGVLVETFTDAYGWPNTTVNGELMYDDTYFKTKDEAVKAGLSECEAWISLHSEQIQRLEAEIKVRLDKIKYFEKCHFVLAGLIK